MIGDLIVLRLPGSVWSTEKRMRSAEIQIWSLAGHWAVISTPLDESFEQYRPYCAGTS